MVEHKMTFDLKRYKPMLAPLDDPLKNPNFFKNLRYPLDCSPKLDGWRMMPRAIPEIDVGPDFEEVVTGRHKHVVLTRELKEFPSLQVQSLFKGFIDLDGEVIAGDETDPGVFNRTQSHVSSVNNPHDDLKFRVFDCCDPELTQVPFEDRLEYARGLIDAYVKADPVLALSNVTIVEHERVHNYDQLIALEAKYLSMRYEGMMMRDPLGPYKSHARSTFNEGWMYKLKRFRDEEGLILGFEEGETNTNDLEVSERGYAKRSGAKAGKVAAGTVGKYIVDHFGHPIKVAPGAMTHAQRKYMWEHQDEFIKKEYMKYRYFEYGMKDLPRYARAVGIRSKIDMSPK